MMELFDRKGNPILTMEEFYKLKEDPEYRVLQQDWVGPFQVSTVWLGSNMNIRPGEPPLIFETAVFLDGHSYFQEWLGTEEDALHGHGIVLKAVQNGFQLYGEKGVIALLGAANETLKEDE